MQSTKMALGSCQAIAARPVAARPSGLRAALPLRIKAIAAPAEELLGKQAAQKEVYEVREVGSHHCRTTAPRDSASRGPEGAGGASGRPTTEMHGARPAAAGRPRLAAAARVPPGR